MIGPVASLIRAPRLALLLLAVFSACVALSPGAAWAQQQRPQRPAATAQEVPAKQATPNPQEPNRPQPGTSPAQAPPPVAATPPAAPQERRVALVIGAGAYTNVPALPNPPNDARDLAAALRRLGFDVEEAVDPSRTAMETALRNFGRRVQGADAALFYYAGHAIEAGGRNWLVPVTADIGREGDLRWETFDTDSVLAQLGGAKLSIIVLDACRDNPFRMRISSGGTRGFAGQGLAPVNAASGTLVAYATAPGEVAADGEGRNSPFTAALLRHIETPGLELRQLFAEVRRDVMRATAGRQVTWDSNSLVGAFYFRPAPPPRPEPPTIPEALVRELRDWERVRDAAVPAEIRAFLERHPNGIFADEARRRLDRPARPAEPAPQRSPESPPPAPPPVAAAPAAVATVVPAPAPAPVRPSVPSAVTTPVPTPVPAPSPLPRMVAEAPHIPRSLAEKELTLYVAGARHRAFAVAPGRGWTYRVSGYADAAQAEEATLERCQINHGEPCALFAVDDDIRRPQPGAAWVTHDMPRVRHAGPYDPERVPGITPDRRRAPDIAGYGTASGPKAMALHHWGRAFAATGAASQRAAEEGALAACNGDPERKGREGFCLLYAAGNRVVLPERRYEPLQPSAGPLPARVLAAVPFSPLDDADEANIRRYMDGHPHRALAANPERRATWRVSMRSTAKDAEESALEGCQVFHGSPCVLMAVGDEFAAPPARGAGWRGRDMPRLRHAGAFDPEKIPFLSAAQRTAPGISEYAGAPAPKAMALHPAALNFIVTGAASQQKAEAEALRRCMEHPSRRAQGGPCYLYASGNTVVFPQRRTAPVTPSPKQ